jgi:Cdc6-like AAA superfamily ATPase
MLQKAFYETLDFRTLVETSDRPIVVGRRGTGKSALLYKLSRHWSEERAGLAVLAPTEDELIGLRPLLREFGERFPTIRAGSRIGWRYALLMEILESLLSHYRFQHNSAAPLLRKHRDLWTTRGSSCVSRLRNALRSASVSTDPEARIADLAHALELEAIQHGLHELFASTGATSVLLIDRLDEGYEPDHPGVGLVAGLIQAAIDLKTRYTPHIRLVVFLRDNIFRTVAQLDPDYSRNIEGHVLRVHWDEAQLFSMLCNRLRVAFNLDIENNRKVWDRCTAADLHGMDGFRQCLRLTLFRPRDLLALLNEAYYAAAKDNANQITLAHLETSAKQISLDRLDDLRKEYAAIIPALGQFTAAFSNRSPESTYPTIEEILSSVLSRDDLDPKTQQDLSIYEEPDAVARMLYSIGFLGIHDNVTGSFNFCHDGTVSGVEFKPTSRLLVHPCYWMALNVTGPPLGHEEAQQISDDYDIQVVSAAPEVRIGKIHQLVSRLAQIPIGPDGAIAFEEWVLRAVRVAFGGHLRNIELHPNGAAVQRRDVVGTNLGDSPNWRRIREDYGTRQVIFEAKNYTPLDRDDYRQALSYLNGEYGKLAFLVTRDEAIEPRRGVELDWIRELYTTNHVLVVKLTAKWLAKLLRRTSDPLRHDEADAQLGSILDTYSRMYIGGQSTRTQRRKRGRD